MFNKLVIGTVAAASLLAGCHSTTVPSPPEYSPGYRYVATGAGGSSKGTAGSILAPEACLNDGIDDDNVGAGNASTIASGVGTHLAPGCANAYNLQRMVESERDLVEGRKMGPAHAAPSTRAAQRYLHGEATRPDAPETRVMSGVE